MRTFFDYALIKPENNKLSFKEPCWQLWVHDRLIWPSSLKIWWIYLPSSSSQFVCFLWIGCDQLYAFFTYFQMIEVSICSCYLHLVQVSFRFPNHSEINPLSLGLTVRQAKRQILSPRNLSILCHISDLNREICPKSFNHPVARANLLDSTWCQFSTPVLRTYCSFV